jgi:hypothetical protein
MSRHNELPPVPPANRSHKGTGDHAEINKDTSAGHGDIQNSAEQGDTANIMTDISRIRPNVRTGSISTKFGCLDDVRFPSVSDQ